MTDLGVSYSPATRRLLGSWFQLLERQNGAAQTSALTSFSKATPASDKCLVQKQALAGLSSALL